MEEGSGASAGSRSSSRGSTEEEEKTWGSVTEEFEPIFCVAAELAWEKEEDPLASEQLSWWLGTAAEEKELPPLQLQIRLPSHQLCRAQDA